MFCATHYILFFIPVQFNGALFIVIVLEYLTAGFAAHKSLRVTTSLVEDYTESWQMAIGEYRVSLNDSRFKEGVNNAVDGFQEVVSHATSKHSTCRDSVQTCIKSSCMQVVFLFYKF